jgi:hypothetical protein
MGNWSEFILENGRSKREEEASFISISLNLSVNKVYKLH